ncbi:MAG: hypothetical protein EGQ87_00970, partial [Clostridiales bacterium]|nr:hypothetical protein [Clostridiales bacterium]
RAPAQTRPRKRARNGRYFPFFTGQSSKHPAFSQDTGIIPVDCPNFQPFVKKLFVEYLALFQGGFPGIMREMGGNGNIRLRTAIEVVIANQ